MIRRSGRRYPDRPSMSAEMYDLMVDLNDTAEQLLGPRIPGAVKVELHDDMRDHIVKLWAVLVRDHNDLLDEIEGLDDALDSIPAHRAVPPRRAD